MHRSPVVDQPAGTGYRYAPHHQLNDKFPRAEVIVPIIACSYINKGQPVAELAPVSPGACVLLPDRRQ